ncbi:hypothetical protein THAOC_37659, partial [Thalassiosira oceanica]
MRFCKAKGFSRALILSGLFVAQVQPTPSCYPTFQAEQAETNYKAGTTVSASIVEHTTEPCAPDLRNQADNKSSLCNADGTRPVEITRTYNYRCVDGPKSLYCQQGWAFDPASLYGHVAWEKLEECYNETALYPNTWRRCPAPWVEMDWSPARLPDNTYEYSRYASYYEPGELSGGRMLVSPSLLTFKTPFRRSGVRGNLQSDVVYQCRRFPDYRHCGQAGYKPPKSPATPGAWKDAWTPQGICDPNHTSTAPTLSPSFDLLEVQDEGCPEVWRSLTSYYVGDLVSLIVSDVPMRSVVYQCRGYPYQRYCNQEAFQPGTENAYISLHDARIFHATFELGPYLRCPDNTMAPTQSPSVYGGSCDYMKCVSVSTECQCDSSDCPNPHALPVGCIKTVQSCESKAVEPYSSTRNYDYGDVVRVGLDKYVCLGFPFGLWCNNPSYQPGLVDGIWSDAWRRDGVCQGGPTQSPTPPAPSTPSPSRGPSQSPSSTPSTSPSKSP